MTNEALKSIAANHQVAEDQISAILNALNIKTESPSEVQLKGFAQVCELMQEGKSLEEAAQIVTDEAKNKATAKDNPESAQKPTVEEREHQLKEVAFRYSVPESDLPKILSEMQYELETLTDAQVEEFQNLCQQLQSGMSLEIAVQSALNNAKAAPTKSEAKSKGAAKETSAKGKNVAAKAAVPNAQVPETIALTVGGTSDLAAQREQAAENLPPRVREVLLRVLDEEAQELAKTMPNMTKDQIVQFRTNLWNQMILSIDHILGERLAYHMNTPEFAKTMEVTLSTGRS